MTTYLIEEASKKKVLTRQIGDLSDIVFMVPVILSMTGKVARFQIWNLKHTVVELSKNSYESDGDIEITDQRVFIPLLPDDTKDLSVGKHLWELEVADDGLINETPITIGQGYFDAVITLIPPITEP